MSEEEWSGRPGQLAIDYRFCYGFHLTLFYGNRRMKFWSWIFQSSGESALISKAAHRAEHKISDFRNLVPPLP